MLLAFAGNSVLPHAALASQAADGTSERGEKDANEEPNQKENEDPNLLQRTEIQQSLSQSQLSHPSSIQNQDKNLSPERWNVLENGANIALHSGTL